MKTISRKKKYDFERCVTKLNHNGPFVKEDVVAAIYATNGNFAQMAICLGRRRSSVRNFVLANLDVKDIYDEVHEVFLDTVEQSHASLALGGDGPSLRFILATLGKDRGYTTRIEQTGKDGSPLQHGPITLDVSKMTTEALRELKAAIKSGRSS